MGRRTEKSSSAPKSQTLPSSPTHSFSSSSSSSSFEFTISLSPHTKSGDGDAPADELFYKGQLLPLHLSPRLSMVRTLLLASSSSASSSTTASRDSSGSSTDSHSSFSSSDLLPPDHSCDSSRPSSVAAYDDEFKRLTCATSAAAFRLQSSHGIRKTTNKYLSRFSSLFRKEPKETGSGSRSGAPSSSVKRVSSTAKEVIRKYLKKVKPLYEKLSQKQQQVKMCVSTATTTSGPLEGSLKNTTGDSSIQTSKKDNYNGGGMSTTISHSFSGNLRYPRRNRSYVSSCPSSMRSSPSHSGILCRKTAVNRGGGDGYADASSMEELQSAIQGAIAHCKNSMIQNKSSSSSNNSSNKSMVVSNEI